MTQGLPLLRKFGHPSAAIARAVARAELPDDRLWPRVLPFCKAVTACAKSLA